MKMNLFLVTIVLIPLILCSCKKSNERRSLEQQYDLLASNAVGTLGSAITNWATSNQVNLETNAEVLAFPMLFSNAAKSKIAELIAVETVYAGQFLLQLHKNNHLPGISKDEHGQFITDVMPIVVSNKLTEISYPMERTFNFVKEEEIFTNHYTVVKLSKDSEWKLQKA
jgi:hypothetical protein